MADALLDWFTALQSPVIPGETVTVSVKAFVDSEAAHVSER